MQLRGKNGLLTGAAGGLGRVIASSLAREGVNLVLTGRNEEALNGLRDELRGRYKTKAEVVTADLADTSEADSLVEQSEAALGGLDLLVNNAGIELTAAFPRLSREELEGMVALNLTAPMLLTRAVLPGMLARGGGHVVNVASLAGKAGPAYGAPYAATKAGLVGFTQSLRAEFAEQPVGFSVVCPGFVSGDGMYARMADQGITAPVALGATSQGKVAQAVLDCVTSDLPEAIVTPRPVRPLLAVAAISPRVAERATARLGVARFFRRAAEVQGRA